MNFSDERYVRLFTRDTATWKSWDWETRSIFTLMLRKVDRAGVIDTGKMPKPRAISLIIEAPEEVVARALPLLAESEAIVFSDTSVVMPKFLEAQESPQSDAQRQRESRQNRAAKALSQPVTPSHTVSHGVTNGHNLSLQTRPDQTVPSRAEPKKRESTLVDAPFPVDHLREIWNTHKAPEQPDWRKPKGNDPRAKHAKARWTERSPSEWVAITQRIAASSFCRGVNDRGWRANPDWFLKPGTAAKVLEGTYDDRANPNNRAPIAAESVDWTQATPGEVAL